MAFLDDLFGKKKPAQQYDAERPTTWTKDQQQGYKKEWNDRMAPQFDNKGQELPPIYIMFPSSQAPYWQGGGIQDTPVENYRTDPETGITVYVSDSTLKKQQDWNAMKKIAGKATDKLVNIVRSKFLPPNK